MCIVDDKTHVHWNRATGDRRLHRVAVAAQAVGGFIQDDLMGRRQQPGGRETRNAGTDYGDF